MPNFTLHFSNGPGRIPDSLNHVFLWRQCLFGDILCMTFNIIKFSQMLRGFSHKFNRPEPI